MRLFIIIHKKQSLTVKLSSTGGCRGRWGGGAGETGCYEDGIEGLGWDEDGWPLGVMHVRLMLDRLSVGVGGGGGG